MNTCLNCSHLFDGKFCNECGQKAATHRFTMREWLHEIPHSLFHVDGGFFHTFKNLCLRPGNMIREYLGGRRRDYFSPFLYALIMCGVFVVVSHLFADETRVKIEITDIKSADEYLQVNYYKAIVILMILPATVSSFLVFRNSAYNFAEHLVLNTFITAQMIISDILFYNIATSPNTEQFKFTAIVSNLLLKYFFLIWTYWQFFKPKNILFGILQIVLVLISTILLNSLVSYALAYLVFIFKGGGH